MVFPSTLTPTAAETELRRRIAERGPLTFAEFMDVALYGPGGYYAVRRPLGPQGDFYTAPLSHPTFGALIARQLEEMWRMLESPSPFWVVEQGAGNGRLAADILRAAPEVDATFDSAVRYVCVDRASAKDQGSLAADWVTSSLLPFRRLRGVVLANELLDAMPVHRVTVEGGTLREIRVAVGADGALSETLADPTPGLADRLTALDVRLAEGHRAEVCLAIDDWARDVSAALDTGYVLVIDYGHEAPQYYDETRRSGTLRCYYQHTLSMDPYRNVGRQDISIHVELTSLRRAALAHGLTEVGSTTQAEFLRRLGFDTFRVAIADRPDLPRPVRTANLRALDTLVTPEGMGGFRVLAFAKGIGESSLSGFLGGLPAPELPAPFATPDHMPGH